MSHELWSTLLGSEGEASIYLFWSRCLKPRRTRHMGGKAGEKDQERPEGIRRLVSASFCFGENAAIGSSCSQISQESRTQNREVRLLKAALWPQVGLSEGGWRLGRKSL